MTTAQSYFKTILLTITLAFSSLGIAQNTKTIPTATKQTLIMLRILKADPNYTLDQNASKNLSAKMLKDDPAALGVLFTSKSGKELITIIAQHTENQKKSHLLLQQVRTDLPIKNKSDLEIVKKNIGAKLGEGFLLSQSSGFLGISCVIDSKTEKTEIERKMSIFIGLLKELNREKKANKSQ